MAGMAVKVRETKTVWRAAEPPTVGADKGRMEASGWDQPHTVNDYT